MGIDYSCQTLESEEETINKIFKDIFKKDFNTSFIYEEFLNCLFFDNKLKDIKLRKKLLKPLLLKIVEENQYKNLYLNYIYTIMSKNSLINSIRKIGLIFINLSIGNDKVKKEYYLEHFFNFYLDYERNKDLKNFGDILNDDQNSYKGNKDNLKEGNYKENETNEGIENFLVLNY